MPKKKVLRRSGISSNKDDAYYYSQIVPPDIILTPPIRQTASIFKQPVTVVRSQENIKMVHNLKHSNIESPKQLFWEKRLEGLRACDQTGEQFGNFELARGIRSVGPNYEEQIILESPITPLDTQNQSITDKKSTKLEPPKNSEPLLIPDQLLMHLFVISDEDIYRQQERVNLARKKLQEALKD